MESEIDIEDSGEGVSSNHQDQIELIKNNIITFLSSTYPNLKTQYEQNPENYYFSAEEIIKFELGKEFQINFSSLKQSEKERFIIIVHDCGNVEFLRLRNLENKDLIQSSGYILIEPQFYDKANYERLNNLMDDEDSYEDERVFDDGLLLIGIDLHGEGKDKRNLKGLVLKYVILIGANLSNTNLTESDLSYSDLSCTNLRKSILGQGTNLNNSILMNTDLSFSIWEQVSLADLQMGQGTTFFKAILCKLTFTGSSSQGYESVIGFSDISFKRATLFEVLFNDIILWNIDMKWVNAEKLSFNDTVLGLVNFSNATLKALSFFNSKTIADRVIFRGATIIESCFLGKVMKNRALYASNPLLNKRVDRPKDKSFLIELLKFPVACFRHPYCDYFGIFSLNNVNTVVLGSDFTNANMIKVLFSNVYFKNCIGIEQLSSAFHSIFKNVHFNLEDSFLKLVLKEKGAKVNDSIDDAFSGSVWNNSDDPDLAKVLANALFGELGRTIVVGGAGAALGSVVGAGPAAGAASALKVDSALFKK